jgi:hypothetical protein
VPVGLNSRGLVFIWTRRALVLQARGWVLAADRGAVRADAVVGLVAAVEALLSELSGVLLLS